MEVQITTSHHEVDLETEEVDACIHSGREPPARATYHRLFGERISPMCSPTLLQRGPPLRKPADLSAHVLVSSIHRPRDWPTWLEAAGLPHLDGNNGVRLENSALAYQAAINGLGVVIAQETFVAEELRDGRLVKPFDLTVATDGAYYFAYSVDRPPRGRFAAFSDWLLAQSTQEQQA
jgi:LysR family glycine cleavage system transcriptional activator